MKNLLLLLAMGTFSSVLGMFSNELEITHIENFTKRGLGLYLGDNLLATIGPKDPNKEHGAILNISPGIKIPLTTKRNDTMGMYITELSEPVIIKDFKTGKAIITLDFTNFIPFEKQKMKTLKGPEQTDSSTQLYLTNAETRKPIKKSSKSLVYAFNPNELMKYDVKLVIDENDQDFDDSRIILLYEKRNILGN